MKRKVLYFFGIFLFLTLLQSCSSSGNVLTPDSERDLPLFYQKYYSDQDPQLQPGQLALYVDYSTCIAEGQHSAFFQALVPSWQAAAKSYYSIEGSEIQAHDADSIYVLLRTIQEKNYADLKTAAERIANGDVEGVLLTDGEYYQPSVAKGNVNNPYLTEAFKTWLKKGHDVYILMEPYTEMSNGRAFQKKRFYFLFTDHRLTDNIYSRVMQTVRLSDYPGVEGFHLSAYDPKLASLNGRGLSVDVGLSPKISIISDSGELQDWQVDWSSVIEPLFVFGVDSLGNATSQGVDFASGLSVDRNSLGGYRIASVKAKVFNINQEYTDFVAAKESKQPVPLEISPVECENFIQVSNKAFSERGEIRLRFDREMYNPDYVLTGSPFNYFVIQVCVDHIEPLFAESAPLFTFESIDLPGQRNVSVAASIEQCLVDPEIKSLILQRPIYTILVKANQK